MESILKYINKRKGFVTFLILVVVPFIKVLLHYFISPFCEIVKVKKYKLLYDLNEKIVTKFKAFYFDLVDNSIKKCLDFSEHFGLLFEEQVFLFIPSVVIVILVVWNFSNKIDDLLSMNKRREKTKKDNTNPHTISKKKIEYLSVKEMGNIKHLITILFKEILSFLGFMFIVNASTHLGAPSGFKGLMSFTLGFFLPYIVLKFIYFIYTLINKKPKWPKSYWWLIIPFSVYLFMTIMNHSL